MFDNLNQHAAKSFSLVSLLILTWAAATLLMPFPPDLSSLSWLESTSSLATFVVAKLWQTLCTSLAILVLIYWVWKNSRQRFTLFLIGLTGLTIYNLLRLHYNDAYFAIITLTSALLAASLLPTDSTIVWRTWTFFLGINIVASLFAYFSGWHQMSTPGFGRRASGFYSNPNVIYPLGLMGYALFYELTRTLKLIGLRRICIVCAIAAFLLTIFTFSRAGWIGLATILLIEARNTRSRLWAAVLLCVSLSLILGVAFVRTHGSLVLPSNDRSAAGRVVIWQNACNVWSKHLWFGYGYGGYSREVFLSPDQGFTQFGYMPGDPKNLYLALVLDGGLFGLIFYIFYFSGLLQIARQVSSSAQYASDIRAFARAVTSSVIALFFSGIVDTPIFGSVERIPSTETLLVFSGILCSTVTRSYINLQSATKDYDCQKKTNIIAKVEKPLH